MDLFEKDGVVYKYVPAGGYGGGITSSVALKATHAEAAAFRQAKVKAEPEVEAEPELKQDGPTIQEWVAEGYRAGGYPPSGYASKSSQEDIDAAIAAEITADEAKVAK
jgi:hypothetical protein